MTRNSVSGSCLALAFSVAVIALGGCAAPQGADNGRPQSLFGSLNAVAGSSTKPVADAPSKSPRSQQQIRNTVERSMPMQKVDNNVWRTGMPANLAFQTLARILSQSYVLGQTDRKQMTVSTEWDKFLIDGRMFRNRVNVGVFPVSARSTEIVVRNAVEYYEGDKSVTLKESNWIPTADVTDEVQRIVGALARQSSSYARR